MYDLQRYAVHHDTIEFRKNDETLKETISKILNENNIDLFVELKDKPFLRICPKLVLHPDLVEFFSNNFIYLEEESSLNFFFKDNFISDNYFDIKIYKNFTIMDIIKLQRLFFFISKIYRNYTIKYKKHHKNEYILLSSIIPLINKEDLILLLNKTLNDKNKDFIDLIQNTISTEFYNLNYFFDIQYNPILFLGNEFLISPTILSKSNLIRSILLKIKNNLSITPNGDRMIKILEKKFKDLGFSIATEVKFGIYEIDIIAKKGNEVFIFECKNSYHPVNEFELRNTYSHVKKASKQLNNLEEIIKDVSKRKILADKIGFSLYKSNFNFAIILSNRMFNGYICNNYRCINSYILKNLLNEGIITLNSDKYSLWKSLTFHESDLVDFINGKFISDYESLAHENFRNLDIQDVTISCQRFGFKIEEIAKYIHKNYRKI
ncbi:hypothetical protein [Acinetobacter soli]|uniref:hypothetical protein n=2 Tax=Acinetobacter soli TaxID=487316 RepID=UPI001250653F|nr:hypothetical protein [Acinetobacter soli]